jgi:hypothetical protein
MRTYPLNMYTTFTPETVPALGTAVEIARDIETPSGEKFVKGEPAVIAEHRLSPDGRVSVGARTPDGRMLRAGFPEAFQTPTGVDEA